MAAPNQMKFFQRGRGVIFNPKIYVADFGNFTQGFLIQNSNFRVQGILTPTPQNGPHLWKSCACISYYCPCTSLHILNHNHYKKFALYVIFQKWGGVSKAVSNFSENSSDLAELSFAYVYYCTQVQRNEIPGAMLSPTFTCCFFICFHFSSWYTCCLMVKRLSFTV